MTMMNSYHYCYYYYCYGYDDYPSCCCCSILLNDFLSLDEHDLLHLETSSVFLRKTLQMKKKQKTNPHSAIRILSQTSRHIYDGHYRHLSFTDFPRAWLNNLNMIFMQTHFTFRDDLCSPAVYGLCTLSICSLVVYFSLYHSNQ